MLLLAVVARRRPKKAKKEQTEAAAFNVSEHTFGHTESLRRGIQNPLHVLAQTGSTEVDSKSASYAEMLGEEPTAQPGMLLRFANSIRSSVRIIRKQGSYLVPAAGILPTTNPVYETPTDAAAAYVAPSTTATDANIYATPGEPPQEAAYLDPDNFTEETYAIPASAAFEENTVTSPKAVPKQQPVFTFTNETGAAPSVEGSTTDHGSALVNPAYEISNCPSPTYQVPGVNAEYAVASVPEAEYATAAVVFGSAAYDYENAPAATALHGGGGYDYGTAEAANQTYSTASAAAAAADTVTYSTASADTVADASAAAVNVYDDACATDAPLYALGSEDGDPVYSCASEMPVSDPFYDAAMDTSTPMYDTGDGGVVESASSPLPVNSALDYAVVSGIEGTDATYSPAVSTHVAAHAMGTALERGRSDSYANAAFNPIE